MTARQTQTAGARRGGAGRSLEQRTRVLLDELARRRRSASRPARTGDRAGNGIAGRVR